MNLRYAREAIAELHDAAAWYDGQRDALGHEFLQEIETAINDIRASPERFSRLETSRAKNIRRVVLKRFPYVVIYEVFSEEVHILAIAHKSRSPRYWSKRRS
jgi:toxin ParE1/3/4